MTLQEALDQLNLLPKELKDQPIGSITGSEFVEAETIVHGMDNDGNWVFWLE